jgi:hypothetical protein
MSDTLRRVLDLAAAGEVSISVHAYHELAADGILARDVIVGLSGAKVLEDYPEYPKGPCLLVLQRDPEGMPIHAVWGIPRGRTTPAVLVTAYRPDATRWTADFEKRKP